MTAIPAMSRRASKAALSLLLVAATAVWGADKVPAPQLALPIECDTLEGCLIQNYFDHDRGPGFADYTCGQLGYDGHTGTDFRLRNLAVMRRGVEVRAASAGKVRAIRDAMPDVSIRDLESAKAIAGREAGNSVAIEHGGGWETQYSHLQSGSVRVRPGDEVKQGQVIGLVGLSGKTEFPHVHLSVRRNGENVDPFVGWRPASGCGGEMRPLWNDAARQRLAYRPTGVIQTGFADRKPVLEEIESGADEPLGISPDASALVFWVELFGVMEGDEQQIAIFDPAGRALARQRLTFSKNQAQWFGYVGKRRSAGAWPAGRYRAEFSLYRAGAKQKRVIELSREIEIGQRG
ncbi:MAG TPA: M23 family metallopeptidase [Gammaproteobacteria bacterium]|nr:M23 family metallopeptidase [Chromatiales bacterium]HOP15745.1 M23 family metallopeptidase [Gammaproteobacteria bacterium]